MTTYNLTIPKMTYNMNAYQVDAEKLRSVWGSNDHRLFVALECRLEKELRELDKHFEFSGRMKSKFILRNIVSGVYWPDYSYLYAYVYELLCKVFGTAIDLPNKKTNMSSLKSIDSEYSTFLPIKLGDDEFPHVLSIEKERLKEKMQKFLTVEMVDFQEEDTLSCKREFKYLFDTAIANKKSLVLFNY